ncbi:FAD binding domain-containing protein [Albidovulum sp.]|uniref:FAD binding domain-containing protein n=1 Tax=Albidovulum sp. TaxID=1872424 RepID=UPI0039B92379
MPYLVPTSVDEALALLRDRRPTVVAGCTDVLPARRQGDRAGDILDVTRLPELRGIESGPQGWRIGAAATWAEIDAAPLPPAFDALRQAAREVGAIQIQNAGTIAGNICNASPAADGVPPLLVLEAEVELASVAGRRRMALADFITGVRRTMRVPDELVVALHLPHPPLGAGGAFIKLGTRTSLVISIAMVASVIRVEGGRIAAARLAVGACSPVAQRLPAWEAALVGRAPDDPAGLTPDPGHLSVLAPIDDVRATAAYRTEAVRDLCRRAVMQAALSARETADAR